jgi:membrane fusion protein (multidrug efflux system)
MASATPLRTVLTGGAPKRARFDRRRFAVLTGICLATIAVGAFALHWWIVGRFIESTDDAYVGGDVTVIAPKVAGFIEDVAVSDNQAVHAGDVLVQLDDRDYRAVLAKATAVVDAQHATLASLVATRRLQHARVAEARARIAAAEAELVRARDDATRYRRLSSLEVSSIQRLQSADADYKKALAQGREAAAELAEAEEELGVIDARERQTQAALAEAIAERDLAELDLEHTQVRSPIDGIVGNRSARVGAYASVGRQLLAIVPSRDLWVDANFKEDELTRMRPGQRATVVADVLPGRTFHGRVESLSPGTGAVFSVLPPENATGNFTKIVQRVPVRIHLEAGDPLLARLRPGLSTTVAVDTRQIVE